MVLSLKYTKSDEDLVCMFGFKYTTRWDTEDNDKFIGIFKHNGKLSITFDDSLKGYPIKGEIDYLEPLEFEEKHESKKGTYSV